MNTAKSHYLLAEKLWQGQNYAAAVSEFEKATAKDPKGKLGLQALFRAATTQALFLGQYSEATKKFSAFIQKSTTGENADPVAVWDAQLQIGEILFSKTEQYEQAIAHYQSLIREKPNATEVPELSYRIGKALFFLFKFNEAIEQFERVVKLYPKTTWAEQAAFQVAVSYFTRGERDEPQTDTPISKKELRSRRTPFQEALLSYEGFIHAYPKSVLVPEARFGIAACLEETGRLEDAYQAYQQVRDFYPSPRVVDIKLSRLKARLQASKLFSTHPGN